MLFNPHSGAHLGEKIAAKSQDFLRSRNILVEAVKLEAKGHAERLCETMDLSIYDVILCVGGDGTLHESINGLMKRKDEERKRIPIAAVPAGTGNSFARELTGHGSSHFRQILHHILRGIHIPFDVSKITWKDTEGKAESNSCYSFNSIHWGMGTKVNVTAEKLRWMGKAIRYTTAALWEITKGEKDHALLCFEEKDGKVTEYHEDFSLLIANNIRTAAKGMNIAPQAYINDGLFDLLIVRTTKTLDLVEIFSKIYQGTHKDTAHVEYHQVKWFSVTPLKKKGYGEIEKEELIDVDGELKGKAPFKCTVLPGAVRVVI